ncbi:CU044_5270 family protein [Streptacidiphilus jiangxiensis]|uniref:CU044_5270 family protein n=1 Tax=Streptacidiphilus jiangxiensis TaxID=235985 RepID=A0A1H7SJW4_STRJI|nr:CU044_5270 family protein [Streptacidiphilus jiangxiensis]SEL72971.1 hypothetical protein SAMN05414137_11263 [Streptacidiphilus jiangxiensis]
MSAPPPSREPLPAPGDPLLPAHRHVLLREHLMREIESQSAAPAPARRRPVRRFVLTTVAAAAAAALVTVLSIDGRPVGGHPLGAAPPVSPGHTVSSPSPAQSRPSDSHTQAVALLEQVADVASVQSLPAVRDDQFVYSDRIWAVQDDKHPGGPLSRPHRVQAWYSADGSRPGLEIAFGQRSTVPPPPLPGFHMPTYTFLASLPTDPKALLAQIYAQPSGDEPRDAAALDSITFMLFETMPPPKLAAGLYRAAAMIPGITAQPERVDPTTGRHVIGLSWRAADDGVMTSWLFDSDRKTFLGYEQVQGPSDHPVEKQGFVFEYLAVLDRAIVDRPGQLP